MVDTDSRDGVTVVGTGGEAGVVAAWSSLQAREAVRTHSRRACGPVA